MELTRGRDLRKKGWFWLDDDYLNGYAKHLGVTASCVYISLCRHADKDQKCFPKMEKIAEELGVSKMTIVRAVKELEKWNIVEITREYDKIKKRQKANVYLLLDKEFWTPKPEQGNKSILCSPESQKQPEQGNKNEESRVTQLDRKDTQYNYTQYKDSPAETAGAEINQIIELFKECNPSYAILYKRKPQRDAVERLLKLHGREQLERVIRFLPKTNKIAWLPTITTPQQLEEKWATLEANLLKEKNKLQIKNNERQVIL